MMRIINIITNKIRSLFPRSSEGSSDLGQQNQEFTTRSMEKDTTYRELFEATFRQLSVEIYRLKEVGFKNGKNSQRNNDAMPDAPLNEFYAACDNAQNTVCVELDTETKVLESERQIEQEKLEKINSEEIDKDEIAKIATTKAKVEFPNQQIDTIEMEETLVSLEEQITDHDIAIVRNKKIIGGKPLRKGLLDSVFILIVMVVVIGKIDAELLIPSLKSFRFSTPVCYALGYLFSIGIVWSSFYMAKATISKNARKWKLGFLLGLGVISLILLIRLIGSYNIELKTGAELSFFTEVIFTSVSILFWFATYLVEKYRAERSLNLAAQQVIVEEKKKRSEKIITKAKLSNELSNANLLNDTKKIELVETFKVKTMNDKEQAKENSKERIAELSAKLLIIKNLREYFVGDISGLKIYAEKAYAENFREGIEAKRPPVKIYSKVSGLFTVLILIFVSTSCGQVEEIIYGQPDHHITVLIPDRTIEEINQSAFDVGGIENYLISDLWQLDNGIPRTKVDFHLSTIDDSFMQKSISMNLEEGKPHATRIEWEREENIKNFTGKVSKGLTEHLIYGDGKNKSKINQCLCRNLNMLSMADSNATKTLIIMSDFLEHSNVSFYRFKDNPPELTGGAYKAISESLLSDCPLNDLSGIQVIGIFNPVNPETDELIQFAVQFWKKHLTNHGAEFSFKANL